MASGVSFLDVVALLNVGVGPHRLLDRVRAGIEVPDFFSLLPVVDCILSNSVLSFSGVAADDHIHDDVFLSKARIKALVDGRVDVDIPDSTAIHKDVAMEVLGWEGDRNRTRGESCLRKL